jgi:phosphatidylserine/phosphatidylglycerophosphate/cardiolipin synthase-like enzyme
MKLLIEPDHGVQPIVDAIEKAKKSLDIAIFRCDHPDIEKALMDAIKRGVAVRALIAYTNRGGEKGLRDLEMRLLGAGAVVARTSDDLAKYHAKYFIVDGKKLIVLGFNFTRADLQLTRSFGVIATKPQLLSEASKVFAGDCTRQPYSCSSKALIVSPMNARQRLMDFIEGAKKQLLIFDVEVSDPSIVRILKERAADGVEIRIIGELKSKESFGEVRASHPLRLHARAIVRDGKSVFIGSQSLRRLELDLRRELGILIRDQTVAAAVTKVFEEDWKTAKADQIPAERVAKKVAKAVTKEIGPIAPVLEELAARNQIEIPANSQELDAAVKDAVKTAVKEAVHEVVAQAAEK